MATAKKPARNAALEGMGDVVDGAAVDLAIGVLDAGLLSQNSLSIDGSHAQEGNDPHPEDGAGAAGEDSAGCTDDIAGTNLRGDGSGHSLEGTHAALMLVALQAHVAEDALQACAQVTLYEAGLDGEPEARAHQQKDQNVVSKIAVDLLYDGK